MKIWCCREWNCAALSLYSPLTSSDHALLICCIWSEVYSIWGILDPRSWILDEDPVLQEWNCAALRLSSPLTSSDHALLNPHLLLPQLCLISAPFYMGVLCCNWEWSFCLESILTVDQQPHVSIRIQYCHLILSMERETAWLEPLLTKNHAPPSHPFTLTQLCSTFQTSFASTYFAYFIHFIYPLPRFKTTLQQSKHVHLSDKKWIWLGGPLNFIYWIFQKHLQNLGILWKISINARRHSQEKKNWNLYW